MMYGEPGHVAVAERLYGGGWRITVRTSGMDSHFYRRLDWGERFPCEEALRELRSRGWDVSAEDLCTRFPATSGWSRLRAPHETWGIRLMPVGGSSVMSWREVFDPDEWGQMALTS